MVLSNCDNDNTGFNGEIVVDIDNNLRKIIVNDVLLNIERMDSDSINISILLNIDKINCCNSNDLF
jgi:hypothetical protein